MLHETQGARTAARYSLHMFSNRVNSLRNASFTVPVGPLRCFEMISSAIPAFSSVRLFCFYSESCL